eukprot:gb/GECH01008777.1/.p1 GENE.gb/GECH01008777.1/~~gb/GECH01008777.1/.p1  ORF type:complete len:628 (+),score=137.84 gb/GECH01008777.1/:1-1884(+)
MTKISLSLLRKETKEKDLSKIENLELSSQGITELDKCISECYQCKFLDLSLNELQTLEHISSLPNLKVLKIYGNSLQSLKGITMNKKLEELYLEGNRIRNIENLNRLKFLKILDLQHNRIENIEGLDNNQKLQLLDLEFNKISKLDGLKNLSKLTELRLSGNRIQSLSSMPPLKNLKELILNDNFISDLSYLKPLKHLQILKLNNNKISSLDSLPKLSRLENLFLANNTISKLDRLVPMCPLLDTLDVRNNNINDFGEVEFIGNSIPLVVLFIKGNPVLHQYSKKEYKKEISKFLPSIRLIDDQDIIHKDGDDDKIDNEFREKKDVHEQVSNLASKFNMEYNPNLSKQKNEEFKEEKEFKEMLETNARELQDLFQQMNDWLSNLSGESSEIFTPRSMWDKMPDDLKDMMTDSSHLEKPKTKGNEQDNSDKIAIMKPNEIRQNIHLWDEARMKEDNVQIQSVKNENASSYSERVGDGSLRPNSSPSSSNRNHDFQQERKTRPNSAKSRIMEAKEFAKVYQIQDIDRRETQNTMESEVQSVKKKGQVPSLDLGQVHSHPSSTEDLNEDHGSNSVFSNNERSKLKPASQRGAVSSKEKKGLRVKRPSSSNQRKNSKIVRTNSLQNKTKIN